MKAGWTTKRLGEVILKTETTDPGRRPDASFTYIDVSSVSSETLAIEETQRVFGRDAPSRARKLIRKSDVLFATIRPTLRRIAIVPESLDGEVCSTGYFVLRAGSEVLPRFLYYFLQSETFMSSMEALQKGASYPAVTDGDVREQFIPLPPLPEQRRIVALLDQAFAGLATAAANAERNLDNARELFESHLAEVFSRRGDGWVETTLGECTQFIDYRGKTPIKTKSGLRLITAKNVKKGYLQRAPEEFVAPDSYSKWMTRGIPERGDVIFTTEAPLANVALLDTDERVVFAQRIIVLQPDRTRLDGAYLKYMLQSAPLQASIHAHGTGATVQGIKASLLKNIPVCFPAGLGTQTSVVRLLDALFAESQRLGQSYLQKQAALAALKRSLLHQAFNGEL